MAGFNLTVPSLGTKFVDYRQQIPGDSFAWDWVRPLAQIKYLVIHHTAAPSSQTPDDIANYHINHNGWGGVGYHFIIASNGTVYYVGDLYTARAHVYNRNHEALGICLVGNFVNTVMPTSAQIDSCHKLCAKLLFDTAELENCDGWEDVVGHKDLGQTTCPSDNWPVIREKIVKYAEEYKDKDVRVREVTQLYAQVFGREPDISGLKYWTESQFSLDQIRKAMVESEEHQTILRRAKAYKEQRNYLEEVLEALKRFSNGR